MSEWAKPLFNRYDPYVIKGKLDEYITEDFNNTRKFTQTFKYSNTRLLLGSIATIFTIIAHVYEYLFNAHFPKDYNITAVCVVGYFFFNFAYQIYEYYYEKEVFYSGNPGITAVSGFDLSSTIKKFDHIYHVKLYVYDSKGNRRLVELKESIAKFFDKDGYLVKSNVQRFIESVLKELNKKTT